MYYDILTSMRNSITEGMGVGGGGCRGGREEGGVGAGGGGGGDPGSL